MNYFPKLFEPIGIGQITVRNRVMMPAMATRFPATGHLATDQSVGYYAQRAEGGVGLIITEGTCVDKPLGLSGGPHQLCIDGDQFIPGFSRVVEAVHSHGAKIAIQLHHAGPNAHFEGASPVAPSPVPMSHRPHVIPRELSKEEIKGILKKFAMGAKRAKQAGFDAVELLCAHGYLLNRFLSPHANKRNDEYGGSCENRVRIVQEIVESIRAEVGRNFPILCKVPGNDYVDGGIIPEESMAICQILEESGVSALTISGGSSEAKFSHIAPMGYPQGWQVHLAEKIKKNIKIPVAALGKIKNPEFAEKILSEGKADMVGIGRSLIADPDFVMKAQRNEVDSIIPCISCNHCFERIVDEGKPLGCAVNPLTGREYDTRIMPAFRSRKVLVVGGGPAGMQAAAVASSRGHDVTLVEKDEKLGGQLLLAAKPPDKEEITAFTNYLIGQLEKKKVKVKLRERATREVVESLNPDVVVVATGALPLILPISGADSDKVVSSWGALVNPDKLGNEVVVIGGGLVGCDVACFIADQGKRVTIVEQLDNVGLDTGSSSRKLLFQKLKEKNITVILRAVAKEISKDGVAFVENGQSRVFTADTVVLAVGARSNRELMDALGNAKVEVYAIGDCVAPRRIVQANAQGFDVGLRL
ncbi:MAG: FAD-dependent oxidoreductase [Deltaproteobacteria bacterium]|nr:FAD-dependent oxidoreductase [Deltaproteobacteria bacterium]